MGLDTTAYEKAVKGTPPDDLDQRYDEGWHEAYWYDDFEQSGRGLERGQWYQCSGEEVRWGAPYSAYGRFREALCRAALGVEPQTVWDDPDSWRYREYFELICFADNEGTIGPEAAADLAMDFDEHAERVLAQFGEDSPLVGGHQATYEIWRRAFHVAANTGLVDFH